MHGTIGEQQEGTQAVPAQPQETAPEVAVILRENIRPDMERHRVVLKNPDNWFCAIPVSPFAKLLESETIAWLDELDLVPDPTILRKLKDLEIAKYAGYTQPIVGYDQASVLAKLLSFWIVWDDAVVEVSESYDVTPFLTEPVSEIAGIRTPRIEKNPYAMVLRQIGDRYQQLGASPAWRKRMGVQMRFWAEEGVREARVRKGLDTQKDWEDAVALRAVTIGFGPTLVAIERAVGLELPDEIVDHPLFARLAKAVGLMCGVCNDCVSVAKDLRRGQDRGTNLVLYAMDHFNLSLREAYDRVAAMHEWAREEFDQVAADLYDLVDNEWKERFEAYCNMVRYVENGFERWHVDCKRYRQVVVEGNMFFDIEHERSC